MFRQPAAKAAAFTTNLPQFARGGTVATGAPGALVIRSVRGLDMVGATDFIGLVRARAGTSAERQTAAAWPGGGRIAVLVTRDGTNMEELLFERPPTLADLLARAGADSYVLGIGVTDRMQHAAE